MFPSQVVSQFLTKNLSKEEFRTDPKDLPLLRRFVLPLDTKNAPMNTNLGA